jgi:uncharacterized protein YpuA (DUF1002 family)
MEENKKNKKELLSKLVNLADKHAETKGDIIKMLDEMDKSKSINKKTELKDAVTEMFYEIKKIELEYDQIVEEIKNN